MTLTPEEIQARVKRLFVDEGATVKEGQVLAELESNQLDARSAALHANLANIDAQIRQAPIDVSHTATSTSGRGDRGPGGRERREGHRRQGSRGAVSMLPPLRYFIDLGYGVILKGNDLRLVATNLAGIAVLGIVLFGFSLAWFTRSLR